MCRWESFKNLESERRNRFHDGDIPLSPTDASSYRLKELDAVFAKFHTFGAIRRLMTNRTPRKPIWSSIKKLWQSLCVKIQTCSTNHISAQRSTEVNAAWTVRPSNFLPDVQCSLSRGTDYYGYSRIRVCWIFPSITLPRNLQRTSMFIELIFSSITCFRIDVACFKASLSVISLW